MPILPLNAVFAAGATFRGYRREPYLSYNFLVEIEGLLTGGFTEVSGLESQIETEEYQEGGVNDYTHYFPTRIKHSNLVLSRGLSDSNALWDWYDDAAHGRVRRKNGTIMVLDRQLLPAMWWNFKDAYPIRWAGPKLNSLDGESYGIEQLELVHHGITKPAASKALSVARMISGAAGFTGTQQILDKLPF